ncbi:MAG: signal peptidase II [Bryobacter sp.]|nr:signal peptidase II [Bryobacter sp.]
MRRAVPWLAAAAIVLADRASKVWIEGNIGPLETRVVIPDVFNIIYTRNKGAAFGLFANAPDAWRTLLLIVASAAVLSFVVHQLWQAIRDGQRRMQWALVLVLGGALGNLYDRVRYGSVTDFLQVFIGSYEWPSFNVADSCITIGAVLLGMEMIREGNARRAPAPH